MTTTPKEEAVQLHINQINLNPIYQNRDANAELDKAGFERGSREHVRSLTNDLKVNGLHKPVTVYLINGKHYLVGGHHRLEAAKQLKWKTIAAYVTIGTKEDSVIASHQENLIPDKPLTAKERTQNAWNALVSNETNHYRKITASSGRKAAEKLAVSEAVIRQMRNALNEMAKRALTQVDPFSDKEPEEQSFTNDELMNWWLTNPPLEHFPEGVFSQWWQARQLLESKGERPQNYQRCVADYEQLLMAVLEDRQGDDRNDEACVEALKNLANRIQYSSHG